MVNIPDYTAISKGDGCSASIVSNNFTKIASAVNSNNLDSDNYAHSNVLARHISNGAILSQHISNSAVQSEHIVTEGIVATHINWASTDGGVLAGRIGVSDSLPERGMIGARFTKTFANVSSTGTHGAWTVDVSFSDAIDGAPGWTDSPTILGEPVAFVTATNTRITDSQAGIKAIQISSTEINSQSVAFKFWQEQSMAASDVYTATMHFVAIGPR